MMTEDEFLRKMNNYGQDDATINLDDGSWNFRERIFKRV